MVYLSSSYASRVFELMDTPNVLVFRPCGKVDRYDDTLKGCQVTWLKKIIQKSSKTSQNRKLYFWMFLQSAANLGRHLEQESSLLGIYTAFLFCPFFFNFDELNCQIVLKLHEQSLCTLRVLPLTPDPGPSSHKSLVPNYAPQSSGTNWRPTRKVLANRSPMLLLFYSFLVHSFGPLN